MNDLKIGDSVNHKEYGRAKVLQLMYDRGVLNGVLLDLLTKEGRHKFYIDRRGILPRCYESKLGLITKV